MNDLAFGDFSTEPGETYIQAVIQGETAVEETRTSLAVYHIELDQLVDGVPVEGARVSVTVDEENTLLGIHSTYRLGPSEPGQERLSPDEAIAIALAESETDLADVSSEPLAFMTWIDTGEQLARAWHVYFTTRDPSEEPAVDEEPFHSFRVTVLDKTRALFAEESLGANCASIEFNDLLTPTGFRDGLGHVWMEAPPIGARTEEIRAAITLQPLREMCTWSGTLAPAVNGRLHGRYVQVDHAASARQASHSAGDYIHRVNPDLAVLRFDFNAAGITDPLVDSISLGAALGDPDIAFLGVHADGGDVDDEYRFDELQAYYHTDKTARFFQSRFGAKMWRPTNARPAIEARVNSPTDGGPGNADFITWLDNQASIFAGQTRHRVRLRFGPGNRLRRIEDDFTEPGSALVRDVYARQDMTRDPTIIAHEFAHAMIYNETRIIPVDRPDYLAEPLNNSRFHEGMADYFAATIYDQSRIGRWTLPRENLPAGVVGGGREIATLNPDRPLVFPDDIVRQEHADGRFVSGPLWTFRDRLLQLQEEIPVLAYGSQSADRIAWGVVKRVGSGMDTFVEPLSDALATDHDVFNKLFYYEIVAAYATQGLGLEPALAIIQPRSFAIDGTLGPGDLEARGFLGTNTEYVAEFSTNPNAFGLGNPFQRPDRNDPQFNYIRFSSVSLSAPPVFSFPDDTADGGFNYIVDLTVPNADLELFASAAGRDSVAVFMQITTVGVDGVANSHEDGAGMFIGVDDPFTLYRRAAAPPGCACSFTKTRGGHTLVVLTTLVALFAFFWRRRTSEAGEA